MCPHVLIYYDNEARRASVNATELGFEIFLAAEL